MGRRSESALRSERVEITGIRSEEREEMIRVVEYSPFPRIAPQQLRVGFSRDISRSGLCLGVDECEAVGSLLRIGVRDIEGRTGDPRVGRVAWRSKTRDGRYWIGIELLTPLMAPRAAVSPVTEKNGDDLLARLRV
jgi:hypothetical protein